MKIIINNKTIESSKTYFIADIGANHDGSLNEQKLIKLAALSGADAANILRLKQLSTKKF